MSSPIIHLLVGLVALLLYFDDRHRMWALLLLPFAVLPDLDHFHIAFLYDPRVYFHNVFMLVPPLVVGLYGLATKRTLVRDVGFMASFLLWTHLMLDYFTGGEALFFPLTKREFAFSGSRTLSEDAVVLLPKTLLPWVNYEALGIVLVFFALAGILIFKKLVHLNADVHERAEQIEG
ncbi:MAG: metal-dependent hydrolase [Halobacteriota archaeon]